MKVFKLYTGSGPMLIHTSHVIIEDPTLLDKLLPRVWRNLSPSRFPMSLQNSATAGISPW